MTLTRKGFENVPRTHAKTSCTPRQQEKGNFTSAIGIFITLYPPIQHPWVRPFPGVWTTADGGYGQRLEGLNFVSVRQQKGYTATVRAATVLIARSALS